MTRPNILLLFSDQHNAGTLGCAGHPQVLTPNLDRLASDGVRFDRAYCQNAVCAPSRNSLFTGHYCHTLGILRNQNHCPHPEGFTPLQTLFKQHGYRTVNFGKRHLVDEFDTDWDVARSHLDREPGDLHYRKWVAERGALEAFERDWNAEFGGTEGAAPLMTQLSELDPEHTMEAFTADQTIAFLREQAGKNQPFFCWSSFYRPHQPYTALPEYFKLYPPEDIQLPETLREPVEKLPPGLREWRLSEATEICLARAAREEELYRFYISSYYALVTEMDHHIGRILDELDALGLSDNTIVVYTSDHGDFVGAHGMVEKCHHGHNVYEDTLRVPLIIRTPGLPDSAQPGVAVNDLVELVDLYPTFLDATGIDHPSDTELPGMSLMPVLRDGVPVGRQAAVSTNWKQAAVIEERYKLGFWIEQQDGYGDMLFDRLSDPLETTNLHDRPEMREVKDRLMGRLRDWAVRTAGASVVAEAMEDR